MSRKDNRSSTSSLKSAATCRQVAAAEPEVQTAVLVPQTSSVSKQLTAGQGISISLAVFGLPPPPQLDES
jgi:hypothetical protein